MKQLLKRMWARWKIIAHAIGRFQTKVIITLFYFIVLAPVGFLFRLFGWDPLHSHKSKHQLRSNWRKIDPPEPPLESLERQS